MLPCYGQVERSSQNSTFFSLAAECKTFNKQFDFNGFNLKPYFLYFLGKSISSPPTKKLVVRPTKLYTFEQALKKYSGKITWIHQYSSVINPSKTRRCFTLHKQWSFPLRISLVNVTTLQFPVDLVTFTEEILNEKLHFYAVLRNRKRKKNTYITLLLETLLRRQKRLT